MRRVLLLCVLTLLMAHAVAGTDSSALSSASSSSSSSSLDSSQTQSSMASSLSSSSADPSTECTVAGCTACVANSTTVCATCTPDLTLMGGECMHITFCSIKDCVLCSTANISRCATCVDKYVLSDDFGCRRNAAGRPASTAVAAALSVAVLLAGAFLING